MAEQAKPQPLTILRRKQVEARIGLSRSTIYAKFRLDPKRPHYYDPTFPKPIPLGPKSVGWIEAEIEEWLAAQAAKARDAAAPPAPKAELSRNTRPLSRAVLIRDGDA